MKILIINTAERKGGAAVACNRLHEALIANGYDSKMLVREKSSDDPKVYEFSHSVIRKKINLAFFFLELFILRFFKKKGYDFSLPWFGPSLVDHPLVKEADIIHLHWVQNSFITLNTIKKFESLKKPMVWTLHDMWAFTGGCHYNVSCRKFEHHCHNCPQLKNNFIIDISKQIFDAKKETISNTIHIVCPSNWLAKEARSSFLLRNNPIDVIPYNINFDLFKPYEKQESKKMMGLDPGKKTILFVSMNIEDERKGFQWFKETIIKLENSVPNWENNYEILAIGRNTDAKHFNTPITYTGRLSNIEMISRAYAAADVFVAPSAQDNLPNTVIESLACGTPVVAFNIGGMPDMIEHEKNGYLAEFQNVADLTAGIQFCLTNKLSDYCRASALDKFNAQAIVNSYTKIYKGISSNN